MEKFFDKEAAAEALANIFAPGDVFEIRALDAITPQYSRPHTVSGYFDYDHIEIAVTLIDQQIRFARGIYYTPNPVNSALLARAANRFRDMGPRESGTADKDIICRRWLLIDCDAIRPSGISSSDPEHAAAAEKAKEILNGLKSMNFPAPVEIDSGNGAQLMYRIDLPAEDDGICQKILAALQSCNSPEVDIDETVFNAARIWRLPGSLNCKGDPIPDRPHRRAKITCFPDDLQKVPVEKLKELAGIRDPEEIAPSKNCNGTGTGNLSEIDFSQVQNLPQPAEKFDLQTWIQKYCPDAEGPFPWQNGKKWIFPICPFNPEHKNRSAIITEQPSGAVGFTCHHNGCKGNDWQSLRKLLEPGYTGPQHHTFSSAIVMPPPPPVIGIDDADADDDFEEPARPWRSITTDQICALLEGTKLGEMVNLYSAVTVPRLPLEAALLKSIVTAACALSGRAAVDPARQGLLPPIGALSARLRINTGGGQVCNAYCLLAGNSASGKDIGNILDTVTTSHQWNLGTSGSAEGIAETLKRCPNGLLNISEFMNWMDEKHWQHRASSFLTEAFSKGYFMHAFSSRGGKGGASSCDYCYPNIMANVQPEIFEATVQHKDLVSGFLGRFLFAKMPLFFGDPARVDINKILIDINNIVMLYEKKHGIVEVPDGYSRNLSQMFQKSSPEKLHTVWRRLVNEYMPRLAVMLSINYNHRTQGEYVEISDATWRSAEKMVQWFFAQAEAMLCYVMDETPEARQQEKLFRRLAQIIYNNDKGNGVNMQTISRNATHTGTNAEGRRRLLMEMIERGWITSTDPGCTRGARFKLFRIPPGMVINMRSTTLES